MAHLHRLASLARSPLPWRSTPIFASTSTRLAAPARSSAGAFTNRRCISQATRSARSDSAHSQSGRRVLRLVLAGTVVAVATVSFSEPLRLDAQTPAAVRSIADAHREDVQREDESYRPHRPLRFQPVSMLLTNYAVFTLCSFSSLAKVGPSLIEWSSNTSLPFVWTATEYIIRRTFFRQFISDDTAEGSLPLLSSLSRNNLGAMLNFSVEVTHNGKPASSSSDTDAKATAKPAVHRPFVDELLHSIDVSARLATLPADHGAADTAELAELASRPDRSGSTFVAIKLSGLLYDSSVLERASAAIVPREWFSAPPEPLPPLSINGMGPCGGLAIPVAALPPKDVEALRELWQALREITERAKQHGNVRLAIDAEYSWYQPAIDAMYEAIAAEYNRPGPAASTNAKRGEAEPQGSVSGPLVYNTFQAYLRRTPSHLAASFERAKLNGYTLGVKLVRGAYVDIENRIWSDKIVDAPPVPGKGADAPAYEGWGSPVWPNKDLTDRCYDGCAIRLVQEIHDDLVRSAKKGTQPSLAVVFASHNTQSSLKVIREMVRLGMAKPAPALWKATSDASPIADEAQLLRQVPLVDLQLQESIRGRIFFAQLYGMASVLTARIQAAFDPASGGVGPHMVLKYIPYGPLELTLPYLIRRALENGDIMTGGAAAEKALVWDELMHRLGLRRS
ncbi:proline dehydrogenase [Moesziomyces antarcticus]|uniref:Proline dehydrogenase n=1 Tax=Pseudozyma antarctica TaxID=84753 RepID=A0A5C3FFP1_PSEA2|nr:proline dehydrogenase [Moesziomyces antarcticus]GAK62652.1 proline dehydrogenase [Moesziomyces antarcticus]SPO43214.1 related to Proline oxidase, mitochondrial precursor [Moesziomyces antarcticus]